MFRIELNMADGGKGHQMSLSETDDGCVIGRSAECDMRLSDDMAAGRHCRIYVQGGQVLVENLDDEIGTCLNGAFVAEPMVVADGAELLVATTTLMVRVNGSAPESAAPQAAEPEPVAEPEDQPQEAVPEVVDSHASTRSESAWPERPNIPAREPAAPVAREEPAPEEQNRQTERTEPASSSAASRPVEPARSESGTSRSWARKVTYGAEGELVDRIEIDLREEFPKQTGSRESDQFRALIARGIERARGYGLESDEHVYQFLRCMVMLDDELDGRNPDTEDVWLTLNHARRTPAQRVDRAVKIATRLASESVAKSRPPMKVDRPPSVAPKPASPMSPEVTAPQSHGVALSDADETAADHSAGTHATRGTPPPPPDMGEGADRMPDIEGFTLKEEIGAGGMGRVFLAHDHQLDKDVAIKVLRSVDPEATEQLQHEARAAARLEHPNIVQVSRFEKMGRDGFYVMQFVRGMDGSKLTKAFEAAGAHQLAAEAILKTAHVDPRRSPAELRELMSPEKNAYYRLVAYWLAGVADGLERAHAEGVLHRDIKPSNLLLSEDGRMMVTDFGLAARPADRQGSGRARVGTPRYLSPERVADWASFSDELQAGDVRADIWSLGAVLYEFLTYRPAYRGTVADVLRGITTVSPQAPTTLVWSVPEQLGEICLKAMARRPDDRFNKPADMAECLRGWIRVDTGAERKGRIPFLP